MKSFTGVQTFLGLAIGIVTVFSFSMAFSHSIAHAASGGNASGYAWGGTSSSDGAYPGIGWISFNSSSDGSATTYGVTVPLTDGNLSGDAWSENYGWLSFNSSDLGGCPSGTCAAYRTGNTISGWARFLAVSGGGFDGWVSLSGPGYGITISGSNLSGYAWSSDLGWIDFSGVAGAFSVAAPTASLTASPNPVAYGGRSTLTWSSTGATSCAAGGPWSNSGTLSGSGLTNPLYSNTTFTLQCTGPGGTSPLQSVTVGVTAAPCSLPWGGTTNDGSSVTAYQSSSVTSPSTCVSQTRTCTNGTLSGSYAYQSCSVTSAAPTASLTADPSILYGVGKTTSLSWFSTNATSCTGTGFSTGGAVTGTTSVTLDTLGSTTFTVTCSGSGGSASDSKVVTVSGQPSITVAPVGPPLVQLGSTITANWSVVNMKSNTCHMTGTGGLDQAIANATNSSGTVTTPPITVASTFTFSCAGLDGTAYSSSFNVMLVPQTMEI